VPFLEPEVRVLATLRCRVAHEWECLGHEEGNARDSRDVPLPVYHQVSSEQAQREGPWISRDSRLVTERAKAPRSGRMRGRKDIALVWNLSVLLFSRFSLVEDRRTPVSRCRCPGRRSQSDAGACLGALGERMRKVKPHCAREYGRAGHEGTEQARYWDLCVATWPSLEGVFTGRWALTKGFEKLASMT